MKPALFLGCSGYYYWRWKGSFYPEDLPSARFLPWYADHFNALELNSTFKSIPRKSTLKSLCDSTPDHFRIMVKVHQQFTHLPGREDHDIRTFTTPIREALGEKLLGFLFQFPPSFKATAENLAFVESLKGLDHFFEFRTTGWWEHADSLTRDAVNLVSPNHMDLPENLLAGKRIYLRFHGRPRTFYSEYTAEQLLERIREIPANATEVIAFFNNTVTSAGATNALLFGQLFEEYFADRQS